MLIDPSNGNLGTLFGHVARGNPQWRESSDEGLATFIGPDAYITPEWYATKKLDGKTVPTWNYIEVQARGPISFFDDPQRLLEIVTRLTNHHESASEKPWHVSDAPAEYIRSELKSIVGFEMRVSKLDGKWKLSQNRTAEDREGVKLGLAKRNRPGDVQVSREMGARRSEAGSKPSSLKQT